MALDEVSPRVRERGKRHDFQTARDECVSLLQELIRIPTINRGTNEPGDGNETPAAELLADFFRERGLEPKLLQSVPGRACVITRLKGSGKAPPILLNAHLDVVEADASQWKHDPFSGTIDGGYIWGRGAIDMKHMAALSANVICEIKRRGITPDRDIIFAGVADEEAGCEHGSIFLADEHPDEVRAEYTLGEIGAFSLHLFGKTFYPIQVAEKGMCWVKATFRGVPGHGSMPRPDSAVIQLGKAIAKLGSKRMPLHPVEATERFIGALSAPLARPQRAVLRRLGTPVVAHLILDHLIRSPAERASFDALLHNTATPTVVRAGDKTNVIPGVATVEIDGRTLPGQTEADFLRELKELIGKDASVDVIRSLPPVEASPETPLYRHLEATVRRHDPMGHPVPFIVSGFTDAKGYSKLGSTCYGFSPVRFDPTHEIRFAEMFHGHNERVPVEGLQWGLEVLYDAVLGFAGHSGTV